MKNTYFRKLLVALFMFLSLSAYAETKIVKDALGREVTINYPLKRIALGFYYTDYLAVGGVKALDNVIGFSKAVWTNSTPGSWELYSKKLPQLDKIDDFGQVEVGTFSVEKVLSLRPDLLILADWQYQILKLDLKPIEKAGIPIVVLDYNRETVERHVASTLALGQITGEEKRAQELAKFYKDTVKEVQDRVSKANLPKPKIYIEFGNHGPSQAGFTYGKDMWGSLVDLAGGDNIAAPFVEKWSPINPEQVIVSKPDVIMITGRETELNNKEAMVMGVNIDEKEALRRLEAYKKRPGWGSLPAIQKGNLHGLYQGASRTLADAAMVQYIAKALYPDLFKDVDPIQTYLDFHKKYLPVVPQGTFGIQAK